MPTVRPPSGDGRPPAPAKKRKPDDVLRVCKAETRCTPADAVLWRDAAARSGMNISEWMRRRLRTAAEIESGDGGGGYHSPETDLGDMQNARGLINAAAAEVKVNLGGHPRATVIAGHLKAAHDSPGRRRRPPLREDKMIIKAFRIAAADGPNRLKRHLLAGIDDQEVLLVRGTPADIDNIFADARAAGREHAVRHVVIAPREPMTTAEMVSALDAITAKLKLDPDRAVVIEHRKPRVDQDRPGRHWHLLVPDQCKSARVNAPKRAKRGSSK